MTPFLFFFVFLVKACTDCVHFRPFSEKPKYVDMGKCAKYTNPLYPNLIGYAEGSRSDPTKCGVKGAWFERLSKEKLLL
jgi:hypothetical protein